MTTTQTPRPGTRTVTITVTVDAEVYEGTSDAEIARIVDHELGDYGVGLDGFLQAEA